MWVAAGFGAQVRHDFVGDFLPVVVEVDGGGVQKRKPRAVARLLGTLEHRGVERPPKGIGGDVVGVGVADQRRGSDRIEDDLHHRTSTLSETPLTFPRSSRR